jgi:hypothetical protein
MSPATLDRLMIEPPVGFIAGSAARQPRNVPSTLTRYISRKSASVVDSMSPKRPMPAELSKTSRRPWRATRSATTRGQASSSVTSRTAVVCGAPSAAASAASADLVAVGGDDRGALGGQAQRRGPADARRSAGDERDLAGDPAGGAHRPRLYHCIDRTIVSKSGLSSVADT